MKYDFPDIPYNREDHLRRLEIAKQRNLCISRAYFDRKPSRDWKEYLMIGLWVLLSPLTAVVGAITALVASGK